MVVLSLGQLNKNSLGRVNPTGGDAVSERTSPTAPTADAVRFCNRQ